MGYFAVIDTETNWEDAVMSIRIIFILLISVTFRIRRRLTHDERDDVRNVVLICTFHTNIRVQYF